MLRGWLPIQSMAWHGPLPNSQLEYPPVHPPIRQPHDETRTTKQNLHIIILLPLATVEKKKQIVSVHFF
jgi:hypothetical protein